MTDSETLDAAKEILDEQEEWGATSVDIARLLLAHDAALAEARAVPEMSNLIKEQIGVDISHDLRCALTESDGLNRVRWNNKAMLMLMRECNRLSVALAEARAENERLKDELEAWRDHWGCDCPADSFVNSPMAKIYDRQQEQINRQSNWIMDLKADRDRLLAALREQVRHCGLCFGKGYVSVGVFGQWVKNDCPDCKDARDLIAEHEGRP